MQQVHLVLTIVCGVLFVVSMIFLVPGDAQWTLPVSFAGSFVVFLTLFRGYMKPPKRED